MLKPLPVTSVELGTPVERTSQGPRPDEASRLSEPLGVGGVPAAPGPDFGATLANAIQGVDQLQLAADHEAEKAALGAGNLHELSLALEKADVAMRVATKVRNKVVEAYHEIMRMSV